MAVSEKTRTLWEAILKELRKGGPAKSTASLTKRLQDAGFDFKPWYTGSTRTPGDVVSAALRRSRAECLESLGYVTLADGGPQKRKAIRYIDITKKGRTYLSDWLSAKKLAESSMGGTRPKRSEPKGPVAGQAKTAKTLVDGLVEDLESLREKLVDRLGHVTNRADYWADYCPIDMLSEESKNLVRQLARGLGQENAWA